MTSRHIDRQFVICLHLQIVLGLAELATMLHVIIVMVRYNVVLNFDTNKCRRWFRFSPATRHLLCVVGPRFATTQNYDKSQHVSICFQIWKINYMNNRNVDFSLCRYVFLCEYLRSNLYKRYQSLWVWTGLGWEGYKRRKCNK